MSGYRFKISPGFLLFLAAVIFTEGVEACLVMLMAISLHEGGHVAALCLNGVDITGITAGTHGLELKYEPGRISYFSDAAEALAGPLMSLMTAVISAAAGDAYFAGLNILFFAFNMLPASITDGGKTLYAVNSALFGVYTAEKIKTVLDMAVCALSLASGVFVLLSYNNPTLLICASVMCISCCKSAKNSVKSYS